MRFDCPRSRASRESFIFLLFASCMLAGASWASPLDGQSADPKPYVPIPSWIHFFVHDGQWNGAPHADIFGVLQPSATLLQRHDWRTEFGFTRARIGLRGAPAADLSFFTLVELAVNGVTAPTGGAVRLLDAQVNWRATPFLNLRFGQFLPDFGRLIMPGVFVPWIDYTDIEKTVLFFNRVGDAETSAARDTGVSVWNDFAWGRYRLQYEVGVFNGTGLQQIEADPHKDFIGSVRFGMGRWLVKGGYWAGGRTVQEEVLQKHKWSASLGWGNPVSGRVWTFVEYLRTTEDIAGSSETFTSDGFYVAGAWRIQAPLQLMYRLSRCRCEENIGAPGPLASWVHSVSVSYRISGENKFMVQYDLRFDTKDLYAAADADSLRFFFSLPFSFRIHPEG